MLTTYMFVILLNITGHKEYLLWEMPNLQACWTAHARLKKDAKKDYHGGLCFQLPEGVL